MALNPAHVEVLKEAADQSAVFVAQNMTLEHFDETSARIRVRNGRNLTNLAGVVHGGVYASVADAVMAWATYGAAPDGVGFTSLDCNVDFLRGFTTEEMVFEARIVKPGRTIMFAECTAYDDKGKQLISGTSKLMLSESIPTLDAMARKEGFDVPPKFL